jgi:hypothetical protein
MTELRPIAMFAARGRLQPWVAASLLGAAAAARPQSVAAIAVALADQPAAPDGLLLTSSILADPGGRSLPAMPPDKLRLPVLVVHHEQDGCAHRRYADLPPLTDRLQAARKQVLTFSGGVNVGDPCEARADHGFNGLDTQVVPAITRRMLDG